MTAITFDTLKVLETLKASGFNEAQAKGIVTILREAQDARMEDLATKQDVAVLRHNMKELELRMGIKTGGMILAGIGILFGLLRAWPIPVQYVPPPAREARFSTPPAPTR